MDIVASSPAKAKWSEALRQMRSALDALDDSGAPGDIGSHLDLAICRLEDAIGFSGEDNTFQRLLTEVESALADPSADGAKAGIFPWPSHPETN